MEEGEFLNKIKLLLGRENEQEWLFGTWPRACVTRTNNVCVYCVSIMSIMNHLTLAGFMNPRFTAEEPGAQRGKVT